MGLREELITIGIVKIETVIPADEDLNCVHIVLVWLEEYGYAHR